MNPLIIAGIASGLSAITDIGENVLSKATSGVTSKLGKTGKVIETMGSGFAEHLKAQQKGHLEQGKICGHLSLQEHLKAEGIFNADTLGAHSFHLSEHLQGHGDLSEWFDSIPEGVGLKLGYEEQDRITLLADNGQYCHLSLESPIGKEAARLFELKQLSEAAKLNPGASLSHLAAHIDSRPLGNYVELV